METCKIYYCYKATNDVNGKVYIGFAGDPEQRWREHKRDAEKGKGFIFHQAIRKHGWDHFHFEVICCGKDKRAMLEYIEPALIDQYQSRITQHGYNMHRKVLGASSRLVDNRSHPKLTPEQLKQRFELFTPELRQKMSDNHWSKKDPEAHREHCKRARQVMKLTEGGRERLRIAKSGKQPLVVCPICGVSGGEISMKRWHFENCGIGPSDETRAKIRKAKLGIKFSEASKLKMRHSHLGQRHSQETKKKLREAHRKFTQDQMNSIIIRLSRGERATFLAIEFGVARQTINRYRREEKEKYEQH